jgi:hypothetical protein
MQPTNLNIIDGTFVNEQKQILSNGMICRNENGVLVV